MPRAKRIDVFENFLLLERKKDTAVYKCKYCSKRLIASSSSRLKDHLDNCGAYRKAVLDVEDTGSGLTIIAASQSTHHPTLPVTTSHSDMDTVSPTHSIVTSASSSQHEASSSIFPSGHRSGAASSFSSSAASHGHHGASIMKFADSISNKQIVDAKHYLARWIFAENIPFSMVDSEFFKDFVSALRPAFTNHLPSRHELSTPMLNAYYHNLKTKIASFTENVDIMCLTSDGWSNIRGDSVVNFVLTTPQPIFHKAVNATGEAHTGEFIGQKLCQVIAEIGPHKIAAVVTDNAANMKSAWKYVQERYPHIFCIGCIAHGLHLLCKDLVTKIDWINDACVKGEKLCSYFWNHHRPKHELEEQQNRRYGKTIALQKYTPTRWGTIYSMFKSLLDSKEALLAVAGFVQQTDIREILLDETAGSLSNSFWHKVKFLKAFFEPLVNVLHRFEKDEPALADVYPRLYQLQEHFNQNSNDDIRNEVKSHFDNRWSFMVNDTLLLAHLLDPRHHGNKLMEIQMTGLRTFLKEKIGAQDFSLLWTAMLQYRAKTGIFASVDIWEDAQLVDGITWWKCHANGAPHLQKLALRVLNIPNSSAASERCWSVMGNIHSDSRNRLTDDRVEKLLCIYFNERMLSH